MHNISEAEFSKDGDNAPELEFQKQSEGMVNLLQIMTTSDDWLIVWETIPSRLHGLPSLPEFQRRTI